MTAQAFAEAVTSMVALPPQMRERLLQLNPHLTEQERLDTLMQLKPVHGEILQSTKTMLEDMEAGELQMQSMERSVKTQARKQAEDADSAAHSAGTEDVPPSPSFA